MSTEARRWTIRSGRTVYETKWIAVREYDAIAPTGAPAAYGAVHMKNLALGVLPIDAQGRTVLVGQERFVFGRYSAAHSICLRSTGPNANCRKRRASGRSTGCRF